MRDTNPAAAVNPLPYQGDFLPVAYSIPHQWCVNALPSMLFHI